MAVSVPRRREWNDADEPLDLAFPPAPVVPTPINAFKTGVVVSDLNRKTLVVEVENRFQHSVYKRIVKKHKRFHVHDEDEVGWVGDTVEIRPCRPRSALKKFELVRIVRQGEAKRSIWNILPMKLVAEITDVATASAKYLSCALRFSLAPSQDELFPGALPKTGRPIRLEVRFSGDMVEFGTAKIDLLYSISKKWSSSEMVNFSIDRAPKADASKSDDLPSIEASVVFQNTLVQIRRFRLDPQQLQRRGEE